MHYWEKVNLKKVKEFCISSLPAETLQSGLLKKHFMAPKHLESQHSMFSFTELVEKSF